MRRIGYRVVIAIAALPLLVIVAIGLRPGAEKFLDWLDELEREGV